MKIIATTLLASIPALLSGCAVFEPAPGYEGSPYHYYGPMPAPYIPEPVYVPRYVPRPHPGATGGPHPAPHFRDRDHDRAHDRDRDRDRSPDRDRDRDHDRGQAPPRGHR